MSMHQFFLYVVILCGCLLMFFILACFYYLCLFLIALNVCSFWSIFTCFCVKNPKTHKKKKIQKLWSALLCFVTRMFCLVPLYKWLCAFMSIALWLRTCIDLCLHIFTLFLCFCLKSSTNVKSQKENELQKS